MLSAESAQRFVELSDDLICACTADGRLEELNGRWPELLGWSIDELCRRPWWEFVHPDDVQPTREMLARAGAGETVTDHEARALCSDGSSKTLLWTSVPVPGDDRVFAIGRDVTERRQREEELVAAQGLLAEAEQIAGVGSWQWSRSDDRVILSPQLRHLVGLGPDELPTADVRRELVHPEDLDRLHAALRETLSGGPPLDLRVRVRRRDGREIVLHHRAKAELAADGRLARVHGTMQDVTDEAELTRRLRRMTRAALEISGASSAADALEKAAAAAQDLTGAQRGGAELIGRCGPLTGPARTVVEQQTTTLTDDWLGAPLVAKHGEAFGIVHVADRAEGVFEADHEQVLAHVAHITAVSLERLDLEDRFLQAQRVEAVGRLAAGIIHDFNNTLAVMLVRSELLQAAVSDPAVVEHAAELHAAARAAADVARDLLALSRTSAEARPAPPRDPTDARDVVRDVARLAAPVLGAGVRLEVELGDEPLPTLLGETDLHQVLMNLVLNARDAIEDTGTITVSATASQEHIDLRVRDDGAGMTPETRSRIFTPYFTTKSDRGGTGLGLAGVQTIIARAGGRIEVDSDPGRGSTFKLQVPLAGRTMAVVPSPASRALPGGGEPVAVIGRNRSVCAVIEALLDSLGYAVSPSRPGRDPDLHGAALLVLEGHDPGSEPPQGLPPDASVLHLTGPDGEAAPGTHVLQRPVSADQLARTVRHLLDARDARLRPSAERDQRTGARRHPTDVHPSALDG